MKENFTIETHHTLHTFANRTTHPEIQNLQKSAILHHQKREYCNEKY